MSLGNYGRFGAVLRDGGVLFRVWTEAENLELLLEGHPSSPFREFTKRQDSIREVFVAGAAAGARYAFRLNGDGPFPDPASRFQPDGVHGFSEVVDPSFDWTDAHFQPASLRDTVLYELHCGTFTPEGTFRAAEEKLSKLRQLGVTAIELMPVGDFPGRWNWGYDGVAIYSPARCYGRPEDLRALVNAAHREDLAVYLDVVYNHFGPDGAYQSLFHPHFLSAETMTPWGRGMNFDGPGSETSRQFFIENALHWISEYHVDGFRLDATHAIADRGARHFLAELTSAVRTKAVQLGREVRVIAEDSRNLVTLLQPESEGGYGLDAVWADDFHHQVRRAVAGDRAGYYADYEGSVSHIAKTINDGWFYEGQLSRVHGRPRGTPATGIDRSRFVTCIQNHDQIGNRAMGERLNHQIPLETYRAVTALLLLSPETPLLFMGQEWASSSPFQYFTDHGGELGQLVTKGRLTEFGQFPEFSDPGQRAGIPDPQAESTFLRSKLEWEELARTPHLHVWNWYRRLLSLRKEVMAADRAFAVGYFDDFLLLEWRGEPGILAVVSLKGGAVTNLKGNPEIVFTSEDPDFTVDSVLPVWDAAGKRLQFQRPGCVVLRVGRTSP